MAKDSIAPQSSLQLKLEIPPPVLVKTQNRGKGIERTLWRRQLSSQLVLLPPNLKPLLPKSHFVFFLISTIRDFDLSGILDKYENKTGIGRPAYDPIMLLTLILYCYCNGTTSGRGIERLCRESVPCRIITGNQTPDHDTIANYLTMHREQFNSLFQQTLELADRFGLAKLKHVSVDGSKIHANASKRKAMSYERMCEKVEKLPKVIAEAEAKIISLQINGDDFTAAKEKEIRKEIKFQRKRLTKIKKAKKWLERRAKDKARLEAKEKNQLLKQGHKIRKIPNPSEVLPEPKDQINFTDPDSRIMGHTGGEFQQSYNAQIAVDSHIQLIVAHHVVQQGNDKKLLEPMLAQVHARLGRHPDMASADTGYFSEQAIQSESLSSIELLVPPDRETHPRTSLPGIGRMPKNISPADRMRRKLSTTRGKELYAQRKCIVEPVYGQMKHSVFGFDQFSWRGLQNVQSEWALVCAAHNLCKLHRAVSKSPGMERSPAAAAA